jgi:hypothetical protein
METILLNLRDATSSTLTLSRPIKGIYTLQHQWIDYHEPDAIDSTCNTFSFECDDGDDVVTLSNQADLDIDSIVTELSNAITAITNTITVTKEGDNQIKFTTTTQDLNIYWSESRAKLLFLESNTDQVISTNSSKTFTFRDRRPPKHYSLNIEEAFSNIITTNASDPNIILSSYESQPISQQINFATSTTTLNFSVREYGALVDLDEASIPDIHIVLKKTRTDLKQQYFICSLDSDSNHTITMNEWPSEAEVIYTFVHPHPLPIIWTGCNKLVTSIGTIEFSTQYEFDTATFATDLNTYLIGRNITVSTTGNNIWKFQIDGDDIDWQFDHVDSDFKKLGQHSGTVTSDAIEIDVSKLPQSEPQMINVFFDRGFSTATHTGSGFHTIAMPMFDSIAAGQGVRFMNDTTNVEFTMYRAHFPEIEIELEDEWSLLVQEV